jgi:ubiquinol-cytochrome c reductase cytochrome b subunit
MSTTPGRRAAQKRQEAEKAGLDFVDDRFGSSSFLQSAMDKIFPDHWSFMVGEVAMYSLVVLIITGIYLALFYVPSEAQVIYHGSYKPLDGQSMSASFESVLNITFNVRAGLVMRQVHHWAAVVFLAAISFHLCRIFFSGAFRRPREVNWTIGLLLLISSMLEGFSGYSLPDDLLSGTGLRVVFSIVESIPLIGTWVAFSLWGGQFPGTSLIPRLFVVHEFLFPLLIIGLLTAHLAILWRQKHTDFPAPGKTETNIHGSRLWPQYAMKSAGLFMMVIAVLTALGGLVQINPIWIYGPYTPYNASAGSQPDWYVGWLDGSLRLWPHWEFRSFGHEIPNPFFPGILIPGIIFTLMFAWPFIDRKIYNDHGAHNLLDYPRDKPFRTAIGCAALAFFTVLTIASADDLIGNDLHIGYERLIEILQWGVIVAPVVTGVIAYKVCVALQRTNAHPIQKPVGGIIVRGTDGSYHTLGDTHHGGGDHGTNGHGGNGHAVDNGHADGNGHSADHDDVEVVPAEPVGAGAGTGPGSVPGAPAGGVAGGPSAAPGPLTDD